MTAASPDLADRLPDVQYIPSPNCDERPAGEEITLVVIHSISLPPGEFGGDAVCALFSNRLDPAQHPYYRDIHALRVSAHFFVRRDGSVVQFAPCASRAWHAGVSSWQGRQRCNDFSIGIELEGCDEAPFEPVQYRRLAELIGVLAHRYPLRSVVGHADIAPGRKTDPGPHFDWAQLRALLVDFPGLRVRW